MALSSVVGVINLDTDAKAEHCENTLINRHSNIIACQANFLPRSCIAVVRAEFESRLRLGNSLSRSVAQQVEQARNAREMVDGKASRWDSGQIVSGESGRYGGLSTIRKSASQSAESKPHPSPNKQHSCWDASFQSRVR